MLSFFKSHDPLVNSMLFPAPTPPHYTHDSYDPSELLWLPRASLRTSPSLLARWLPTSSSAVAAAADANNDVGHRSGATSTPNTSLPPPHTSTTASATTSAAAVAAAQAAVLSPSSSVDRRRSGTMVADNSSLTTAVSTAPHHAAHDGLSARERVGSMLGDDAHSAPGDTHQPPHLDSQSQSQSQARSSTRGLASCLCTPWASVPDENAGEDDGSMSATRTVDDAVDARAERRERGLKPFPCFYVPRHDARMVSAALWASARRGEVVLIRLMRLAAHAVLSRQWRGSRMPSAAD
jgi:hypothetical protein